MPASIVWFHHDLRIDDNPALARALERRLPLLPVFIWAPHEEGAWAPGERSRLWLAQSLRAFGESLQRHESHLVLRRGESLDELKKLIARSGADAVFWNERYEPALARRDDLIRRHLGALNVGVETFPASTLFPPGTILTGQQKPFQVFTAFWKRCLREPEPSPLDLEVRTFPRMPLGIESLPLDELRLGRGGLPSKKLWSPGELGARKRLEVFLARGIDAYDHGRDVPAIDGVSRLSPHLHFGEISVRRVWAEVSAGLTLGRGASTFLKELGWREFAYHLLAHFPTLPERPLREEYARFPWKRSSRRLAAWQQGRTGYPIVDAGMRQLAQTGWMHNRVRMIAGSFLVKDLRMDWREGAQWFWEMLVDADLANNTMGWQWVAGCGADASPFFRVFNPVLQGKKFDPEGVYVRRFVPEVDEPDYPEPIVDHGEARREALAAYTKMKAYRRSRRDKS